MFHGVHGEFRWLESGAHKIDDVLRVCPEVVKNKGLVVTAFTSGPPLPSDEDLQRGWKLKGSVLYIPSQEASSQIPLEVFRELYIFQDTPAEREFAVFVNYDWFTIGPAIASDSQANSRWDLRRIQRIFWQLLDSVTPESYLACGRRLIFVTRNASHFGSVLRGLSALQKARSTTA
jgi:hypothetical protein